MADYARIASEARHRLDKTRLGELSSEHEISALGEYFARLAAALQEEIDAATPQMLRHELPCFGKPSVATQGHGIELWYGDFRHCDIHVNKDGSETMLRVRIKDGASVWSTRFIARVFDLQLRLYRPLYGIKVLGNNYRISAAKIAETIVVAMIRGLYLEYGFVANEGD